MAKITALPQTTALTGDEHLPIVQAGATKRATLSAFRELIVPFLQNWYKGDTGPTGPSNNTRTDLARLKAAAITDKTSLYDGSLWWFSTGDFSALVDDALTVASDAVPATQGAWQRIYQAVRLEWFGAIGDGQADDGPAIHRCLASLKARGGGRIMCRSGAAYRIQTTMAGACAILWDDIEIDLNGADFLLAPPDGSEVTGIQIRNRASLHGGTVHKLGAGGLGPSQRNMTHHCCILIGEPGGVPKGYSGWHLHDLTIKNERDDDVGGAGIIVYSGSSNGMVEDIDFPNSSTLSTAVRCHWASYTEPGAANPTQSAHPNNILIRNIKLGSMTKPAQSTGITADVAAIDIVAGYNIRVENVTGRRWSGDAFVQIRAGAFGSAVADDQVKAAFMTGITVENVSCARCDNDGLLVNGRSHGGGSIAATVYAIPALVRNVTLQGPGDASVAGKATFKFAFTSGALLDNCEGSRNDRGFMGDEYSSDIVVENSRFHHNRRDGVVVANATTRPRNYVFRRTWSYANGQGGDRAAGFYVEAAIGVRFESCTAGDPSGEATQFYGFRLLQQAEGCGFAGTTRAFVAQDGARYQFMEPVSGSLQFKGGSIGALSSTDKQFVGFDQLMTPQATAIDAATLQGQQIVITNMRVVLDVAPGSASASRTFKLVDGSNGATGLEVSIIDNNHSGSSPGAFITYFPAIVPKDGLLAIESTPAGTPALARAKVFFEGFVG